MRWSSMVLLLAIALSARAAPFLESELLPARPLVQQQVVYTLRLYRDSHLQQGHFLSPEIPDMLVYPAGESEAEPVMVDGRTMERIESRWLLFPQRSGRIELPAPVFSGWDFYLKGEPRELEVLPRPAGSGDFPWVVTPRLGISETWSRDPAHLKSGEILVRTLRVVGRDLLGAQLPSLQPGEAPGFLIQALPARTSEVLKNGVLIGERVQWFRYLAQGAGSGELPPVEVRWWDPEQGQPSVVRLPGRSYQIEAAGRAPSSPEGTEARLPASRAPQGEAGTTFAFSWPVLAWAAALLSVLLLLRHLLGREGGWQGYQLKLALACLSGDPRRVRRLARKRAGLDGPSSRPAVLPDETRRELEALDRVIYGRPGDHAWNRFRTWRMLSRQPAAGGARARQGEGSPLPSLWKGDAEVDS